jgi:Leucine-rich repeat (LRR) protein
MECRGRIWSYGLIVISLLLSACGSGGGGGSSSVSSTNIGTAKPTQPNNLIAVAGDQQVSLYWLTIPNASSYNLYWSNSPGVNPSNGTQIANITSGYVHQNLTNAITYYYVVTAVNNSGESLPSIEQAAIPQLALLAGLFSDNNLQTCIDDIATQNNWVYTQDVTGSIDCSGRAITSLVGVSGLSNVTGLLLANNTISDISLLSSLAALSVIDLRNNTLGQNTLQALQSFPNFNALQSLLLTGNIALACNDLAMLIVVLGTGVIDMTVAQAGVNCTDYIADPSNSNLQPWPTGVVAVPGDLKVTLNWNNAIGASSYNIYWSTTPGVTAVNGNQIANVSSGFVQSGLINFTPYYYIVTAIVAGVESLASQEVSAIPSDVGVLLAGLFADANLQNCIDNTVAANGWTFAHELTEAVDCSSASIQNISGIENLTALKSLNLINNSITDINPLVGLGVIQRLLISNNTINNIQSLSSLTSLSFINISNNSIVNVQPLSNLTALDQVYLNDNAIVDVSPLATLSQIDILDLRNNAIGGQGIGNVDSLLTLRNASSILLAGNINISCVELVTLVDALGQQIIDVAANASTINCDVVPNTPQGFSASGGDRQVILDWLPVTAASAYNLYWATTPGVTTTTGTAINNVTPGYRHTGLNNAATYYYILTAMNSVGESPPTVEVSVSPQLVSLFGLFPDTNLQACINEIATLNNWTSADQVVGLVNCSMRSIYDLTGLEHLSGVSSLSLNSNIIKDISILGYMNALTSVSIYDNQISEVTPLANLSGLTNVDVSGNGIVNVAALAALGSLQILDLSNNKIGDGQRGNVDSLTQLTLANSINLNNNLRMSCSELTTLISALGSNVVEPSLADDGNNCLTPSLQPTELQAIAGANKTTLNWKAIDNVSIYYVYWSTTPGVTTTTGTRVQVTRNQYIHNGLINDTAYYYIVTAQISNQEGQPSVEISATPSVLGVAIAGLFPDSQLGSCINSMAGPNGWLFAHEITGALNCSSDQITNLSGLEYLTSLSSIRFGSNQIQDISALSTMVNVTFLDLFNNQITDITPLAGLTSLSILYLHENNIVDISSLASLPVLDYLILDGNNVLDPSPLASRVTLTRLFFRNNGLTDVSSLAGLTNLTDLYLNDNQIVNAGSLSPLVKLRQLDLRNNAIGGLGIGNVDALSTLVGISRIWLGGNLLISCSELLTLNNTLGPAATDLGLVQEGVNCVAP